MVYKYFINLFERGDFYADVRDEAGETIFEMRDHSVADDGYMSNMEDIGGLRDYLTNMELIESTDMLVFGN